MKAIWDRVYPCVKVMELYLCSSILEKSYNHEDTSSKFNEKGVV